MAENPVKDAAAFPGPADQRLAAARFRHHLQAVDIRMECLRPRSFDDGPSLAGRIRGGLGRALARMHADPPPAWARRRALFGLPSGFELLFGEVGGGPGWPQARTRPYVLAVLPGRGRFTVVLRLFGQACFWQVEAEAALRAALEEGIALTATARSRAPVEIVARDRVVPVPEVPPEGPSAVTLHLTSPTALARGEAFATDPSIVAGSLIARARGVAAWHGIALSVDEEALSAAWRALAVDLDALEPIAWDRHSRVQPERLLVMAGYVGPIRLFGPLAAWAPLLVLAPVLHLGSHTAFGMGRCRLVWEDAMNDAASRSGR